jgi:hypothetical protein
MTGAAAAGEGRARGRRWCRRRPPWMRRSGAGRLRSRGLVVRRRVAVNGFGVVGNWGFGRWVKESGQEDTYLRVIYVLSPTCGPGKQAPGLAPLRS